MNRLPLAWTPLGSLVLALVALRRALALAVPLTCASLLTGAQTMPDPITLIVAHVGTLPGMATAPQTPAKDGDTPRIEAQVRFEDRLTIADPSGGMSARNSRLATMVGKLKPRLTEEPVGDALCLTQAIYFEARGEPLEGQLAVAQVVLNRYASPRFPKSLCGVVFEHHPGAASWACQFSFACDSIPDVVADPNAWASAKAIAFLANSRRLPDVTGGRATHYHATWVLPNWATQIDERRTLGNHIFYREG